VALPAQTGRVNQKLRTRNAILQAAAELMSTGREVTMLEVARAALVSEATAYRYFPDLASLLSEAMAGQLPDPARALSGVADSGDPVERVAVATEFLLRHVLAREGAVRAMIASTVIRPGSGTARPGLRFGLIDYALTPLAARAGSDVGTGAGTDVGTDAGTGAAADVAQLKRDLAVVVSAEALFTLTDLYQLAPEDAIVSIVRTATTLTRAYAG
jgi:AcrR family transcriptional regulator